MDKKTGQQGAYEMGQKAKADGKKLADNPYTEGKRGGHFNWWAAGYKGESPLTAPK